MNTITIDVYNLLKQLISTQSFSREEIEAANVMEQFLILKGEKVNRSGNNVWCFAQERDDSKPTLLFNSHIDTVKPSSKWTKDPFTPTEEDGKLYGLGSNDAGGPLVSLLGAYLVLRQEVQPYNLVFAATAEEEVSGANGIASIVEKLGKIDLAIIGEPTQMNMAVAEKGLMVLDCVARGKSGHAARNEGDNAIYKAIKDIEWFKNHKYEKISEHLGEIKMSVTMIEAGTQHNVVPDACKFVVDVRTTEHYPNKELYEYIQTQVDSEVTPRSFRINPSSISTEHPIVKRGISLGMKPFGSPTTSDQALVSFTTIKIGPGDSARSHTADEYILKDEIINGVKLYVELVRGLAF